MCSTWFSSTCYRLRYWGVLELSFEKNVSASVFFGLYCIVDRKLLLGIYRCGQLRNGCWCNLYQFCALCFDVSIHGGFFGTCHVPEFIACGLDRWVCFNYRTSDIRRPQVLDKALVICKQLGSVPTQQNWGLHGGFEFFSALVVVLTALSYFLFVDCENRLATIEAYLFDGGGWSRLRDLLVHCDHGSAVSRKVIPFTLLPY